MARLVTPALALLLAASALLSLSLGSTSVPVLGGLGDWLAGKASLGAIVIGDIRLPRTLLALGVGAALGLSGAALQGLLRNPLADPALTGASQGAALGAAAVFYFSLLPQLGSAAPAVAGLAGALAALLLMLALAGGARPAMVIMAGLAISTLAGAALATVLNFAPNPYAMQELVFWLLGSVSERGLDHLALLGPALLAGAALIFSQRRLLSGLSLGEQVAESMGLNVRRGSRLIVLGVALLVGSSVAVAGAIGFVGLLVPHLVRPLVRHRPERVLLPAALAGATLVCLADIGVRLLPPGRELKLGVLTALLGTPLFVWLVWKERNRWS
ncbi:FecCD family ABC transporter permease [Stutzerimonas balearica]|jgi:iron complex transport system permease protein|uniref:FecCD family ABC transporter permease n=1 Tax=Stutzerimonas balearica TaxID=74829 RepID=UPI000773BA6C|nr:iron ABC transporter permease [Stutzerimonas balearica]MBD3738535.1 iron ABC transporter permease [Stutzerimonas balearica]MBK3749705.1 iron chelate uptake ABC transporter family permease subunit [Stutzerimonas balearica]MBK3827900.1 iron chelate uptake ABC transporter family permease subunit [Stutzerimonas balearica]MBK3857585.1 iron chelate uptake ABC transporter family permease subunit [Stutzerimonas balearica]MBS4151686.1 iron ABC transporter permease [Stutzerimonas balearica]